MTGILVGAFFNSPAGGTPPPPAPTIHTYNANGSYTETIPSGYTSLTIEGWGTSGDGGLANFPTSCGGGGGASGCYCRSTFTITPAMWGQTILLTIGSGGSNTLIGTSGGSFSMSEMFCFGGGNGADASAGVPGAGGTSGTASGGNAVNTNGNSGSAGAPTGSNGGAGGAGIVGINGTGPSGGHGQNTRTLGQVGLALFAYTP